MVFRPKVNPPRRTLAPQEPSPIRAFAHNQEPQYRLLVVGPDRKALSVRTPAKKIPNLSKQLYNFFLIAPERTC